MPRLEDCIEVTGLVLENTRSDVKFNFGHGETWVPKVHILENFFNMGDIKAWHIREAWIRTLKYQSEFSGMC